MAKINNIFKNQWVEEASEYLELNGFLRSSNHLTGTLFTKDDKAVLIYADKVSFRELTLDEAEPEFAEFASFEGINMLTKADWIYLFHITKILHINTIRKNVQEANIQLTDESRQSFSMIHFTNKLLSGFGKTGMVLILVMLLISCNTERQIQMQKGVTRITNGRIYFEPVTAWNKIPFDTTFKGFRVRNTAVRKTKN